MDDDISRWLRGEGLEIVLIVLGAILAARLVRWVADRFGRRLQADLVRAQGAGLADLEQPRYAVAVVQALAWVAVVLVGLIASVLVLVRLDVPLTGVVPPVAVAAAALGLGGSRIVSDLLSGFCLLAERQYGIGDSIRISPPGSEQGIDGTVEAITLRVTRIRTSDGDLVLIPNGEIRQVTNRSLGWSRVVVDVPVPLDRDVDEATRQLRAVVAGIADARPLGDWLLDPPEVVGAVGLGRDLVTIRVVARTTPSRRGQVERELRLRLAAALGSAGASEEPSR